MVLVSFKSDYKQSIYSVFNADFIYKTNLFRDKVSGAVKCLGH